MTPAAGGIWAETVLYTFCSKPNCADGEVPFGPIFDAAGNLYGTTATGGAHNEGVVFELIPAVGRGWTEKILHTFCSAAGCLDGANPRAGLTFDVHGNLYGTTNLGGAKNLGTVFELIPNGWVEGVLHHFGTQVPDGSHPNASVIFDAYGNLYGTTIGGGAASQGTIFELTPKRQETILYNFCSVLNCADGFNPGGSLFFYGGNLYGTTETGGAAHMGTVFEIIR